MIRMKGGGAPEKPGAKPEEAIPLLRDILEIHRLDVDSGSTADELFEWVKQERPNFEPREYGFQEFSELLNYAQDKGLVRNQVDEERGLIVFLGAEFHPPAPPPQPVEVHPRRGRRDRRAAAARARTAHRHRRNPDSRAASQGAAPSARPAQNAGSGSEGQKKRPTSRPRKKNT